MKPVPKLLVVDDEPSILALGERFGRLMGFDVHCATAGRAALAALDELKPHVVLVDLQMPEMSGIDVLRAVLACDPDCQVILMTGNATIDSAIEAVKAGALDYLSKPLDFARLKNLLTTVLDGIKRRERLSAIDVTVAKQTAFHGMIGRSAATQRVFTAIQRFAPLARTVLVTGETGTGKELVAKALHALGPNHNKRLVTLNCSAVVETLFESELFGHVRGAFTGATDTKVGLFEHANGGTLFLDEAGELPLSVQAKLLRAVEHGEVQRVGSLETRPVDVCIVAATNRNLRVEVAAGRFRADLFYRLSIIEIQLPPLRDRREDIPYLTAAFLHDVAKRLHRPISGVSAAAEQRLQQAAWPGNIRELHNVIERACILSDGPILTEPDVIAVMSASDEGPGPLRESGGTMSDPHLLSTAQRDQVRRALREASGNKAAAARSLGVSRRALYRWLERLNIEA